MEAHEQKIQERLERILGPEITVLLDDCDFMKDFQEKLYWEFKSEFQKKLERRIAAQDIEDRMRKLDVGVVSDADELEDDELSRKSERQVSEPTEEAPGSLKETISEDAGETESEGSVEASAEESSSSSSDFCLFSQKEEFEKYISPKIQNMDGAASIEELYAMAEEAIAYHGTLASEDKSQPSEDLGNETEKKPEMKTEEENTETPEESDNMQNELTETFEDS